MQPAKGERLQLEAEGFVMQPVIETLPRQHILIFDESGALVHA